MSYKPAVFDGVGKLLIFMGVFLWVLNQVKKKKILKLWIQCAICFCTMVMKQACNTNTTKSDSREC